MITDQQYENPCGRGFEFLTGDLSWHLYGGAWVRKAAYKLYHVVRFTNMRDAVGEDSVMVELLEFDLLVLTDDKLREIMTWCYGDDVTSEYPEDLDYAAVEALLSYGWYGMLHHSVTPHSPDISNKDLESISYREVKEEARLSRSLTRKENLGEWQDHLKERANQIGSTVLDFINGVIDAGLQRYHMRENGILVCSDSPLPGYVMETVKYTDGMTKAIEASHDPLAFQIGLSGAIIGLPLDRDTETRKNYADEYLRGYREGLKFVETYRGTKRGE